MITTDPMATTPAVGTLLSSESPDPICPMIPPDLHGPIKVTTTLNGDVIPSFKEIEQRYDLEDDNQ